MNKYFLLVFTLIAGKKYFLNQIKIIEQLWKAPELQSSFTNMNKQIIGTPKGDVYSFAIIVQEILYRKGVFYLTDEDKDKFKLKNENNENKQLPLEQPPLYDLLQTKLPNENSSNLTYKGTQIEIKFSVI